MSGREVNGRRVTVQFGAYSGTAGVQDRADGAIEAAIPGDLRKLREVTTGTVDGQEVAVDAIARASFVPGLVVITCRLVAAEK